MEFLIELLLDLIFEGSIEIIKNKKISKWIRYPIIILLIIFFAIVIFGILFLGLLFLEKSFLGGMSLIVISVVMLILAIKKFNKVYLVKIDKE